MSKKPDTTMYFERLNTKIRPQDNYFEYVNSKWIKANPIPADERKWGTFNKLHVESQKAMHKLYEELQALKTAKPGSEEQQARDFYYTGMNFDKFEKQHIDLINSHFAKIDAVSTPGDLSKILGELHSLSAEAAWRVLLDADDKDSKVHILRFDQGGIALPDRDYYLEQSAKMRQVRAAYKIHLKKVHALLPKLAKDATTFSKAVFGFEKTLAEISRTKVELRDIEKNYNKVTYAKLQADYPNINWPAYAKAIGWKPDDKICVDQPEFMTFVNRSIEELPLDTWKAYLKWQLALPYYARISSRFSNLKFEFFGKILSGVKELPPLWKRVGASLGSAMGEATGKLYVKQYFSEDSKKQVLELVENLRRAYSRRINKLAWMSPASKKEAQKKLKGFKILIGYPDKWRNFSGMKVDRSSYLKNVIEAEKFNNQYHLWLLHQPVARDEWFMHPQTVNAYHDYNRRAVCFPAAILQTPFFDPNAPDAANYGAIGSVIGHELTHGFDDQGCKFDSEGNARVWQTKEERKEFKRLSQLVIDQASSFEVLPGLNMKGELVIGEAIADLGGLEIAYDAYTRSQNKPITQQDREIFFISFATGECGMSNDETARMLALTDPHPADEFRVNATASHVDDFYSTYNLKPGDKLYRLPEQRAKIW